MALRLTSSLWFVFLLLVIANALDAYSTAIIVEQYGSEAEANPFVRFWIDTHGIPGLYMVKFVVLGIMWLVAMHVSRFYQGKRAYTFTVRCMWAVTLILYIVVVNNFILVARLGL